MVVKPLANSKSANGWLSKDKAITVLLIHYAPPIGTQYLIWSDLQKGVAYFPSSEFEIIDPDLPKCWKAVVDLNGNVELIPKEWAIPNFWDRYYENDPVALQVFQNVLVEMTKA